MNVLLTAAGRRSYLVNYFRSALSGRGKVICANSEATAPAMRAADVAITVPRSDRPDYVERILEICDTYKVRLMLSLHDLDLLVLSRHRETIREHGVVPLLPSYPVAQLSLDKWEMKRFLDRHGLETPWTSLDVENALHAVLSRKIAWPLFVKERLGFGSSGVFECQDEADLLFACNKIERTAKATAGFYMPQLDPGNYALIQQKLPEENSA